MKNYRDPFERTRLEEASFIRSTRENRSNFPRKMFPSLFFASPLFLLSPPLCRAPPSSRTAVSISGTEGKFDPAIIVFPEIEGTVVAGNGDRLTELWLSLSSHHCHATLNSRMGGGGEMEQQKTDDFRIKPPTGVFLENRPGLLPRQSVIYFPPDLPPTRRFAVSNLSDLLLCINKRGFAFIGERGRGNRRAIRQAFDSRGGQ